MIYKKSNLLLKTLNISFSFSIHNSQVYYFSDILVKWKTIVKYPVKKGWSVFYIPSIFRKRFIFTELITLHPGNYRIIYSFRLFLNVSLLTMTTGITWLIHNSARVKTSGSIRVKTRVKEIYDPTRRVDSCGSRVVKIINTDSI